jgi:hypothetical protein
LPRMSSSFRVSSIKSDKSKRCTSYRDITVILNCNVVLFHDRYCCNLESKVRPHCAVSEIVWNQRNDNSNHIINR